MSPSSFFSFLQIIATVAILLLSSNGSTYHSEALDHNAYNVRVQRVAGATGRHNNHYLRNGHQQGNRDHRNTGSKQNASYVEYLQAQRVANTLHSDLHNENHKNRQQRHNRKPNSSPERQR